MDRRGVKIGCRKGKSYHGRCGASLALFAPELGAEDQGAEDRAEAVGRAVRTAGCEKAMAAALAHMLRRGLLCAASCLAAWPASTVCVSRRQSPLG